jgi:exopolysaccharide biosynthesis protein
MQLVWRTVKITGALLVAGCCIFAAPPEPPSLLSWEKPIAPGLVFREELDFASHHSVFALRLSLGSNAVRPICALANGKSYSSGNFISRLPVSKMVANASAIAGINGDFFSLVNAPSGDPLGLAVSDGRILSTPSKRVAFGWGPADARMSSATFSASIDTKAGSVNIDGINRKCPANEITLDTEDAGLALSESPCVEVKLRLNNPVWSPSTVIRGKVVSVSSETNNASVGPNEAILVARGNKVDVLNQLRAGTDCYVKLKTTGFDWEKIDSVVGGGPALIRNGTIAVDAAEEGFNKEFSESKHPRTAIGKTSDNDLWLVAVDGRQETGDGMTLEELAHLMRRLGCVEAMNLDGGGSTTMNVLGVTVNRPSDGKERPVADGVLVLGPKPPTSQRRFRISAPFTLDQGTKFQAQVLADGSPVPNIDVIWGASGACAIDAGGQIQGLHSGAATITASCQGHVLTERINVTGS